jgi:hypothetical protein
MPNDRGFVVEDIAIEQTRPQGTALPAQYRYPVYFWGSVIAGTLVVLSVFVLSYLLMLGLHVGVAGGVVSLGWGAAVWIVVTSCIAYYFGGMTANSISPPLSSGGWLKGAAIWGLSIPLAMVVASIVAGCAALTAGLNAPHMSIVASAANSQAVTNTVAFFAVPFGAIWTAFTTLICGLIFAALGCSSVIPTGNYRRREGGI